ncbi:MAG: hypothetical protein KDC48_22045 [Planctomycetes bacterium]|nr:hypothetical protein [Planctomycetota bacterium]
MSRRLLHITLFATGLLATSWLIRAADRLPFWSLTRPNAAALEARIDEVDTLFLGSSRIYRGINPIVFDAQMAALGAPTSSFNMGQPGTKMYDTCRVVDWLLARRPAKLARVFIEIDSYVTHSRSSHWMSRLMIETHEPSHFAARLRSVLLTSRPVLVKLELIGFAAAHTIVNALRIGQGVRILDDWCRHWSGQAPSRFEPMPERGFEPLGPTSRLSEQRRSQHEEWRAEPDAAAELLSQKRANPIPAYARGGFDRESFLDQTRALEAAGIEVVYVIMPSYAVHLQGRDGVEEILDQATVLSFEDPDEYAELYEFDHCFDQGHMVRSGAELFSRLLARTYAGR